MSKYSSIVTAMLVPVLFVSSASAAAPAKKKKPKAADTTVAAPVAPAKPYDPEADSETNEESFRRVQASINGFAPKDGPTPTITKGGDSASSTLAMAVPAYSDDATARTVSREALHEGVHIAPLINYGSNSVYGLGIGLRAGYTLPNHLYLGATFGHHFGGSDGLLSYSFSYVGPEVGYNLQISQRITIRPYVGGGLGYLATTYQSAGLIPGGGGTTVPVDFTGHTRSPFFWPGATIFLPLGDEIAIGADLRVLLAPGLDTTTATVPNNGALQYANTKTNTPSPTAFAAGLTASYRFF